VAYDLVIYGGTSAGIAAAVQARRMDLKVVVIEPGSRVGGLTTGGLGQTDIGNKAVIGGISREFYRAVREWYAREEAWKWQARGDYSGGGAPGEDTQWRFEPSAALAIYQGWIRRDGIEVVAGERMDRTPLGKGSARVKGVVMEGPRITSLRMESGREFPGKMFVDATYEGDLMAGAGVGYTVGREANAVYGETYNGVQTKHSHKHQLQGGIDPYVEKGNPSSGLLPGIDPTGPGEEGSGDKRVQAYNFRMCLTDHPENRIPFAKPSGYDEARFELLFRHYEAGVPALPPPWINSPMPNRKTDTNNFHGFSTDFIGQNYAYPEASYAERGKIVAAHRSYQQGLMWTLANHPRLPEPLRTEVSRWGMCKDEFTEGGGWQEQLYVREARRMVAEVVMTQRHCQRNETASDSVGMGAYNMDSHNAQRYVDAEGHARNEGDVQVRVPPYPISYRSIIPRKKECVNLAVPVCLSASHIAYGSIRMEPVFMILGQSAATAAAQALAAGVALQDVDYAALRARLLADGQILEKELPPAVPDRRVDPGATGGVVVDDTAAEKKGPWIKSTVKAGIGEGYWHDGGTAKGECEMRFVLKAPHAGRWHVEVAVHPNKNRSQAVPVTVAGAGGTKALQVDMTRPGDQGLFRRLATLELAGGREVTVVISNKDTRGHVVADAARLVPAEGK
jgi:hypothetical protein